MNNPQFPDQMNILLTSLYNDKRYHLDEKFGYDIKYNKNGFRSPEFFNNPDILFSGCSFTFGTGLPYSAVWGTMLANDNDLSYNSIGIPGGSCMDIVFNIFKYFKEFGHPKNLLVLFPDFNRLYTYMDGKILNDRTGPYFFNDDLLHAHMNDPGPYDNTKPPRYISLPTKPQNLYSKEFTYTLNAMYIKMLEIYCNQNGINFIWFKWLQEEIDNSGGLSGFSNHHIIDTDHHLKPYTALDPISSSHSQCHKKERRIFIDNGDIWSSAKDKSHYGIHWQIHVKEIFQDAIKEKGWIKK